MVVEKTCPAKNSVTNHLTPKGVRRSADEPDGNIPEIGNAYSREALKRLSQRIYFDTADWYWKDEGSGHLPVVRYALLTGTALKLTRRVKGHREPAVTIVKPYGIVGKAGEWHLVAAPIDEQPTRYRLNLVDHLALTDLCFSYPEGEAFHRHLQRALDAYERAAKIDVETVAAGFRNDDSRLRSTRGRTLTE